MLKLALLEDGIYEYATASPGASGNGKWQWLLASALARTGFSVVVGIRNRLRPGQEEAIGGVRFVGMKGGNLIPSWSRFLASEMPDWWYYQGAEAFWGALVLVAKTRGVRGIFSTSSDGDIEPRTALLRRQRWWPLYAWGLNAVERIFVQHSGQLSKLSPKLQRKAQVVPGLVSVRHKVQPKTERRNHIAWVAFLREGKRPDLLIQMARQSPDLRYVVCGGTTTYLTPAGYGEQIVKELRALPNVDYLGHVSAEQTLDVIANAAALLCTSKLEGFPNTFLEAWSAGTPVVSLDIDPGDVIKRHGLGFVSGTLDQALLDVRRLIHSRNTFDAISTRARSYVEAVHSDTAVAGIFNKAILGVG